MVNYRVLESLEQFAAGVNFNHPGIDLIKIYQTFGIALEDVTVSDFHGQTFSVVKTTNLNGNSNITSDEKWSISVTNGSESVVNNSMATLHIPEISLSECVAHSSTSLMRLVYFAFFKNSLFITSKSQLISSIVVAARVNCSVSQLLTPISLQLQSSSLNEVSQ